MRILVYPHTMKIGGSQLNAVQLAGAVRDRGHDVIVASQSGPLVEYVHALGLSHLYIPAHRRRPSFDAIRALIRVVRERSVDVMHVYESMPMIEAFFGPRLSNGTPVLATIMSMSVRSFLPRTIPLTVGTEKIRFAALAAGYRQVAVIEPPVDVEADHPEFDGSTFRAENGIDADEVLVAIVCRLSRELKLEGLRTACDAIGALSGAGSRVRLVIVGDGGARAQVAEQAEMANRAAGHQVVLLTGELVDPRPVYAAADIILGQGGSALRGMAFGKPLIILGELGFVELLNANSAPMFLEQGWYGLGPGSLGCGTAALRLALERLIDSPDLRRKLGNFGRQLAVERFSLSRAAQLLEQEYLAAVREPISTAPMMADLVRSATGVLASKVRRTYLRWHGDLSLDSPNMQSAAAHFIARSRAPSPE